MTPEETAREIVDKYARFIEPKEYYATIEDAIAAAIHAARIEALDTNLEKRKP